MPDSEYVVYRSETVRQRLLIAGLALLVIGTLVWIFTPWFANRRFQATVQSYQSYNTANNAPMDDNSLTNDDTTVASTYKKDWIGLATQVQNTSTLASAVMGAGTVAGAVGGDIFKLRGMF